MKSVFSRITVPYDGSELSKKALETAISFAKQDEGIEIDLITVSHIHALSLINVDRQILLDKSNEALEEARQQLKSLPNKVNTTLLEGNPGEAIVEFAKKNNTDLIMIGSRGLGGLQELFLGSVSHHVAQKANCHILVIK